MERTARNFARSDQELSQHDQRLAQLKLAEVDSEVIAKEFNVKDTTVVVRLGENESDSLDTLVSAGIFKSRMEAANFLIAEGIKAQASLFARIQSKMDEIERLRNELRETVGSEIPKA